MAFKSYKQQVKSQLKSSKEQILEKWATTVTAEYKSRIPVGKREDGDFHPGLARRDATYEIMENQEGIRVGSTPEAYYMEWVENGSSKQPAQHILENTIIDCSGDIENIAKRIMSQMGD